MKRFIALIAVVAMIFVASVALANDGPTRVNLDQVVKTYVCTNATGTYANTAVDTATIVPGVNRLLGYEVTYYNTSKGAELVVALYDTAATTAPIASIFAESEFSATDNNQKYWPYPKALATQLQIRQGPNTTVTIIYE